MIQQMLNTFRNLSFTNRYIVNMAYVVITCIISKHTTEYLHIPFTMLFFIVNYGFYHTELYLSLILLNVAVILLFNKSNIRTYSLMALNLFTFGIVKQFSYLIDLDVKNKNNISIQFMLLVPKMYYTSKELIDVRYLFYLPGILAGPVIPLFDFINRKESFFYLEKLIYTIIFGVILMLRKYFPYEMLVSKENQGMKSFAFLFFYGFLFRSQFYFAWSFSSFCYALCGLKVDNLDPIKFESADNVQEVMRRWNVYVSIWLKQSVFLPCKKYGNTLAGLLSCIVSSMWHGFYISYFMMFLSFAFCVTPLKNLTKIYQTFIPVKISKLLNILITSLFVSFFSVPFYFLSVTKTIEVWRQVYYYGLVYVLIGYLSMGFMLVFNKKEKKE